MDFTYPKTISAQRKKNPACFQLDTTKITNYLWFEIKLLTGYPKNHLAHEDQKTVFVMNIFWIHLDFDQRKGEVPVSKSRWYFPGWWKGRLALAGAEKSDLDQMQWQWLVRLCRFHAP